MNHIKKINELKIYLNFSALLNLNPTQRKLYVRAELENNNTFKKQKLG